MSTTNSSLIDKVISNLPHVPRTKKEQKKRDAKMFVNCIFLFFLILVTFGLVVFYNKGLDSTAYILLGFLIVDVIYINRLMLKYMDD